MRSPLTSGKYTLWARRKRPLWMRLTRWWVCEVWGTHGPLVMDANAPLGLQFWCARCGAPLECVEDEPFPFSTRDTTDATK